MSIYEKNVKKLKTTEKNCFAKIKCKCGSVRIKAEVGKDDYDEFTWLKLTCKKCGNWLFYNGA